MCRHLIPRISDKGRGTVASQVGLALLRPCDSVVSSFVRVVGASLICFTSENQVPCFVGTWSGGGSNRIEQRGVGTEGGAAVLLIRRSWQLLLVAYPRVSVGIKSKM